MLATGLLVAAVGVGVFWDGGFEAAPQWTFAAIAGAAGLVALAAQRARAWSAPVVVLLALAALQALSAAWAIVPAADSLRAAALTVGYAALVVAGSGMAPRKVAWVIAVAAGVTGLMGLVSASLYSTIYAERIEGGWRPEGPFGYPPALALVQVFAMPALLTAMVRARPAVSALAAAGAGVGGGVLILDANRFTLAASAVVLGIAVALARRRVVVVGAVGLFAAAALAFHLLLGGFTSRYAQAVPARAVAVLVLACAFGALWTIVRRRIGETDLSRRPSARPALVTGVAIVVVALVAGLLSGGALSARRFGSHQGFTHGRTWMWSAAYRTAVKRPLQGFGAGTFYQASVSRQPGHGRVTRFAHNLPLESWVETGIGGLLLVLALYAAAGLSLWRARGAPALWLLGPAVAAFLLANLVDWPWHLAGVGALAAAALGGVTSARALRP